MSDSKITLAARQQRSNKTLDEQLKAIRLVELALLEKRAKALRAEITRMEREADQADTVFAFECDKEPPKS